MQVYVTQTGSRYHARTDQSCMENAKGFIAVDLGVAVDGGLRPCLVCDAPPLPDSSEGDRRWLRAIDEWHKAGVFESIWEEAFARRILARMNEMSADDVEPQAYIKAGPDAFKVDFLIPGNHLVLEVDGFAKAGQTPTSVDLERRNRRDAALQAMGYSVLHFTNAQVQEEPQACTAAIRTAIAVSARSAPPAPASMPAPLKPAPSATGPGSPASPSVASTTPPTQPPAGKSSRGLLIGLAVVGIGIAGILVFAAVSATNNSSTGTAASTATAPGGSTASTFVEPSAESGWLPPLTESDCPPGFLFKANETGLVHPPDNEPFYSRTKPERCYATLPAAEADGYALPEQYTGEYAP